MAKYKLTKKAVQDLTNIWDYTFENWSENQAEKYYKTLITTFEKLANNPNLGKHSSNIKKDLFAFKINKHIIFYRIITNNPLEITRILHERMDIETRLSE